jgi:hypothetical protein
MIILIFLYKVVVFFTNKSRNEKFKYLFYYPRTHLELTKNIKRKRRKEVQNFLSISAYFLLMLYIVLIILYLNPAEVPREQFEEQPVQTSE